MVQHCHRHHLSLTGTARVAPVSETTTVTPNPYLSHQALHAIVRPCARLFPRHSVLGGRILPSSIKWARRTATYGRRGVKLLGDAVTASLRRETEPPPCNTDGESRWRDIKALPPMSTASQTDSIDDKTESKTETVMLLVRVP